MADSFSDVLRQSVASSIGPDAGINRVLTSQYIRTSKSELNKESRKMMKLLSKDIREMQAGGEDPEVIDAFKRMLESYVQEDF